MALDKATVARIARLARIKLPDADQEAMTGDLSRILGFVEQLSEVPTEGVPPMSSVAQQGLRRRPDTVADGRIPEKVLGNAPAATGGFYTVPKVVE